MKCLVIDPYGYALDFSLRAQANGHQIKHFIKKTPKTDHIGKGLVELVDEWQPWFRWADLIFCADNTKYVRELGYAKQSHDVPIIYGGEDGASWELDRGIGQAIFKKHGIPTIPGKEFTDYDAAIAHVKKHDQRFVSKPNGDEGDKSLSYVSKSPSDMVYMLERWKRLGKLKSSFILQEFVPGTEMAVGGWFGPGGFNEGWCENFEFKKLMNGDIGPATGEMGTVLRYVKQSKLAKKVLAPMEQELSKIGYVGYVDVNCIIDEKGNPWPLEWTTRPGYPTLNIQQPLHDGDMVEWLMNLAKGMDSRNLIYDKIAVGIVIAIPDFPYSHLTRKEVVGVPIYGLTQSLLKHFHPCEMQLGEDIPSLEGGVLLRTPMLTTAGDYVAVMTAIAGTVKDAALTAQRRIEKLTVPNSLLHRTDIGRRLAKQLPLIQKNGFAAGMMFSATS